MKTAASPKEAKAVIEIPAEESGRADNAMGAPPILFNDEDWAQFEELCGYQCTLPELAAWFQVSDDTIETKVKEKYGRSFSEIFQEKRLAGVASLRRASFGNAIGGNPALQIFLLKNLAGYKDRQELSTPPGQPMEIDHSMDVKVVHRMELVTVKIPRNGFEPGGSTYDVDADDTEGSTVTGAPAPAAAAPRVVPDHLKRKPRRSAE